MLSVLGIATLIVIAPFLLIVFFGAPYVPTHNSDINEALQRVNVDSNTKIIDLGSGDGRLLVLAAEQGAEAIGYELNPWMWFVSWLRIHKYRTHTSVYLRDYRSADLGNSDVVFVFTSGLHKGSLEAKLKSELPSGALLLSNGFRFDSLEQVDEVGSIIIYKQL